MVRIIVELSSSVGRAVGRHWSTMSAMWTRSSMANCSKEAAQLSSKTEATARVDLMVALPVGSAN